jgi:hypothetical protein
MSAWSEPTAPVTVPTKHRIWADSIVVPRTAAQEPQAKVSIVNFYKDPGIAPPPAAGVPGALAPAPGNNPLLPGAAPLPGAGAVAGADPLALAPPRPVWLQLVKDFPLMMGELAEFKNITVENAVDMSLEASRKLEKINFETNDSMLLDLRNNSPLASPRSDGPAELLFLDAAGRLVCVDSTADQVLIKDYQAQTAEFQPLPMVEPNPREMEEEDDLLRPRGRTPPPRRRGRDDI